MGGGEASAAQEPQPEPQPQPKATLEATPQTSPVTTPVLEVCEDEEGLEDTDYTTYLQAAQSTLDPWPATA